MIKKLKYTHPCSKREANRRKAAQAAREAGAQAYAQWQAEQLQIYAERARTCTNSADRRALCIEVWAKRHCLPQAVSTVSRILQEQATYPRA